MKQFINGIWFDIHLWPAKNCYGLLNLIKSVPAPTVLAAQDPRTYRSLYRICKFEHSRLASGSQNIFKSRIKGWPAELSRLTLGLWPRSSGLRILEMNARCHTSCMHTRFEATHAWVCSIVPYNCWCQNRMESDNIPFSDISGESVVLLSVSHNRGK